MDVAVIGGGIGGMAAATALARRGARVTVYEQAGELGEVGAGLQVSANGQAVLRALGAVDGPPANATVAIGTQIRDGASGRLVTQVRPPEAGPTWYFHRADLLSLLVDSAERAGVNIVLGRYVTPDSIDAGLIVAADGFRGTWRSRIDGPDQPQFTGHVAWRALVPWDGPELVEMAQLSMGHRAHVVLYPLRGGRLANLVAVEERRGWTEEGWALQGDPDEFRERFADFRGQAGEVIAAADQVHLWALHLRPVAHRWQDGRVALLGDAAHPTLPFMAQGACLALEDAWVLAAVLDGAGDLAQGLARYQELRQTRAARVVALARGNAWRFHLPKPWAWGAQAVLRLGSGALARRLDWVYSYDATRAVD